MTERELLDAVVETAKTFKWLVNHQRPARTGDGWRTAIQGDTGFPDLVLLRPPRLMFVELKVARGKRGNPRFDQATWLNGLETVAGVKAYVWRPEDWTTGRIEDALR